MRQSLAPAVITAACTVLLCTSPNAARAGEEMLVSESIGFSDCRASVAQLLATLKAAPEQVRVEVDTGALYRVKVVSEDANLVFLCNGVAGSIAIARTTPGERTLVKR